MTFESEAARLQRDGVVGALALIGADGKVYWQTQNWQVDGGMIIKAWVDKAPMVIIQGVKYSTIDITNSRMVCTNVQQQGHIVIAKTPFWQGFVMAWCSPANPVRIVYVDIAKLASEVRPG
ncbi:MAG: hypothetical protein EAX90_08405 [Candidatus Heimdallarchaeota archaeon]|nr:hypothetical protein [Candidatus Heimdallarchaeota archaeon]